MKLKRVLFGRVSMVRAICIWILCFLSAYLLVWFATDPNAKALLQSNYWESVFRFGESLRVVNAKYVDHNQSSFEKLTNSAISGMVGDLDRHSSFFSPDKYKMFQDGIHRRYVGVGIMIREVESGILITKVFTDGPADKGGLLVGDLILAVNNQKTEGASLEQVSNRVRGEAGTKVNLSVRSLTGEVRKVSINRGPIEISSVEEYYIDQNQTGYLHLLQFTNNTYEEVLGAIESMTGQGMKRIILDLRDNAGGLLSAAVEVAGIFLPPGKTIVTIREKEGNMNRGFKSKSDHPFFNLPLVVLINEGSASASEVVAGAISVLNRAALVGEKSYGKGSVQSIFPLSDGYGMRLTTAMYFLPDGTTIHEQGLNPDVLVPFHESNETKLRIQRYGRKNLNDMEFERLFGFKPIEDIQLKKAKDYLLENSAFIPAKRL